MCTPRRNIDEKKTTTTTFNTKAMAAGHHKMKINVSIPPHKTEKHAILMKFLAMRA
jgi:hypothetical protein